jgi:solute:Na+ symporter, SSS family
MTATLVVSFVGMALIAALGFLGRRRPTADLAEWTLGGRRFGAVTMWFLQAGEVFTTFTFLGMAGLAFSGGVAAMYSLPYVPLAYAGLYFLAPVIWRRARRQGQLTQADFVEDFYGSKLLGTLVAVLGVVFLLPYLQLQITGLGLAVELATGNKTSGDLSMVIAFLLVVGFVLWAGIRGVASTSYFKDALMLVVLIVLVVLIPAHFAGGIGPLFDKVLASHTDLLSVHPGTYDKAFFFSSLVASTLGVLFMTLPHSWPALLSAGSPRALRRNYVYLPIYSVCIVLPMIIGFTAVVALSANTDSNSSLLTLVNDAWPDWAVGVVVVATAATAMVPAAGLIIGMSTLIARNIIRVRSERGTFAVNQASVVVVTGLALVLAIARPDLLANLLLLTYSGLDQLIPAIGLALFARRLVGVYPILAGLVVGEAVVIWLTFSSVYEGHVNVGLIALVPNIVVVAVGALLSRRSPAERVEPARKQSVMVGR